MLIDESDLPLGLRNHCLFAFVLCCGNNCSVSFQSFILRHLVIVPVCNTKKPLAADTSTSTDYVFQISSNLTRKVEVDRIKTVPINCGIEMGKFLYGNEIVNIQFPLC